jgi:hypothetical protein
LAGITEGVVAGLIHKGVEKIASRKNLTCRDLTVLLLHEQSRSIARLENATKSIASELKELRKEIVPLLPQAKDLADIKAEVGELKARVR